MVSRQECDESFRFVGYDRFEPVSNIELKKRITEMEHRLGNTITDKQRLLLINALRCNNMVDEDDPEHIKEDKLKCAFDEVDGAEICSRNTITFPYWKCVIWLQEVYINGFEHLSQFTCHPLIKGCYLSDLIIPLHKILWPINVTKRNRDKITFIVPKLWLKDYYKDFQLI